MYTQKNSPLYLLFKQYTSHLGDLKTKINFTIQTNKKSRIRLALIVFIIYLDNTRR